ncbi:COX1-domain-containing protein, partial [Caulochytrium protostelioides]
RVHFILFTIAVNLVFMPMHFLGLQGMPRRIGDYPDSYMEWNHIISIGSILTAISVVLYMYFIGSRLLGKAPEANLLRK